MVDSISTEVIDNTSCELVFCARRRLYVRPKWDCKPCAWYECQSHPLHEGWWEIQTILAKCHTKDPKTGTKSRTMDHNPKRGPRGEDFEAWDGTPENCPRHLWGYMCGVCWIKRPCRHRGPTGLRLSRLPDPLRSDKGKKKPWDGTREHCARYNGMGRGKNGFPDPCRCCTLNRPCEYRGEDGLWLLQRRLGRLPRWAKQPKWSRPDIKGKKKPWDGIREHCARYNAMSQGRRGNEYPCLNCKLNRPCKHRGEVRSDPEEAAPARLEGPETVDPTRRSDRVRIDAPGSPDGVVDREQRIEGVTGTRQ